jgi:MFS transporter, OCT family, solute carrier family 22 (organic cation transporter), member 4/5
MTGVEAVGQKYRVICGFVYQAMFSLGSALVGLIAFFVRDWRILQLVISLPMFTLTLFHWFE